jgi:hypothetical protein
LGVIFTKKNNIFFSNGEHPLWKTPEIAVKTPTSGYSRKIIIPDADTWVQSFLGEPDF